MEAGAPTEAVPSQARTTPRCVHAVTWHNRSEHLICCTQVDRSAAYAARWVAKSLVKAGLVRRVLVQVRKHPGFSVVALLMCALFLPTARSRTPLVLPSPCRSLWRTMAPARCPRRSSCASSRRTSTSAPVSWSSMRSSSHASLPVLTHITACHRSLELKKPIFQSTASYGHFGRPGYAWETPKVRLCAVLLLSCNSSHFSPSHQVLDLSP